MQTSFGIVSNPTQRQIKKSVTFLCKEKASHVHNFTYLAHKMPGIMQALTKRKSKEHELHIRCSHCNRLSYDPQDCEFWSIRKLGGQYHYEALGDVRKDIPGPGPRSNTGLIWWPPQEGSHTMRLNNFITFLGNSTWGFTIGQRQFQWRLVDYNKGKWAVCIPSVLHKSDYPLLTKALLFFCPSSPS